MNADSKREGRSYFGRSFFGSLLAHSLAIFLVSRSSAGRVPDFGQEVVYSLTIEGGKSLGGMVQIPESDKKSQIAPPKNVNAPQPKSAPEEKAPPPREEPKKVEPKTEPPDPEPEPDAEVSLAEQREKERKERELKELEKRREEEKKKRDQEKKEREEKEREKEKERQEKERVEKERVEKEKKRKEDERKKKENAEAELNKKLQSAMQRYLGESSDAGGKGFGAAAKTGGQGMGGGVVKPPEFFIYKRLLEKHIKSGRHWYDTSAPLICQVAFEIAPDGRVSNVFVVKGSGNAEYDRSVLKAVKDADPVPPPPQKVYQDFASVRMIFDPRE